MALEDLVGADKFIDDLVDTNPVEGDDVAEGNEHIQGIKNVLGNSFPAITGAVTATQDELNILDGATVTTAELNLLDGVTATTAELNYVDGVTSNIQTQLDSKTSGVFANDASGGSYISATELNYSSYATNTYHTIGPTGSGATYIWTALDSVPSGAAWIEVRVTGSGTSSGDSANALRSWNLFARKGGSSLSSGVDLLIAKAACATGGTGLGLASNTTMAKIQIDASGIFELRHDHNFNSSAGGTLHLTGYGEN